MSPFRTRSRPLGGAWRGRTTQVMNRWHARRAAHAPAAEGFVSSPEPRCVGSYARGTQLLAGNLLFAGHLVEAPGAVLWDISAPDAAFTEEINGFAWLDDLAAVGDAAARDLAQRWLWAWIARAARGSGPGWEPDLAGRRIIRWIHHAMFLLQGQDKAHGDAFFKSLSHQSAFLERCAGTALPGLPRFEALTGLLYAGISLEGKDALIRPAIAALHAECRSAIDPAGGLSTRNPEELLAVVSLLTWASLSLQDAERHVPQGISDAVRRIVPTLRALRHANGELARFHGGGRGADGLLDQALAEARLKGMRDGPAMGYARLSAGRTSLIVDAAPPPQSASSYNAHASTLAFELTSGRRPLIVNCGSGATFGEEWRRAGRATPSHSTLALEGFSSARLGPENLSRGRRRSQLVDGPRDVPVQLTRAPDGHRFEGGHDGYVLSHGLTHARSLELTFDGRGLVGEDLLVALDAGAKARFDAQLSSGALPGVPFQIRFHLHPDVDAAVDLGGAAVSMVLRSGEVWLFRHEGLAQLSLDPSVYLDRGRLRPRATKQIVLTHRAMSYATRLRWSLAKAQETATAVRDFARDETEFDATEGLALHD